MFKKTIAVILLVSLMLSLSVSSNVFAEGSGTVKLEQYADVRGMDLSKLDLRDKKDILDTLTFDTETKWPSRFKMPWGFDPAKLLEYGKDPGLGVKKLHQLGYTGKGVNVAYIDQPLLENHNEYKNTNLKYYKIRPETLIEPSMHGPAVLSLLAGKDIGVVPDSNIYFLAMPTWLKDQTIHAEALYKLIEVNKTLPDDKKIKIVGFSDGVDIGEKNVEAFEAAIKEAEANGIMVFTTDTMFYFPLTINAYKDKDNPQNYIVDRWFKDDSTKSDLGVPDAGRTTAVGYAKKDSYTYWAYDGGLSWTVPYVVGTIALGLQVDPDLTKEDAIQYLKDSATITSCGKVINPEGFINLVEKNLFRKKYQKSSDSDYYYVLYNSLKTTPEDVTAIQRYSDKLSKKANVVLKDVSGQSSASDIFTLLKQDQLERGGNLKGIQIFGTADDVPSFDIQYKIKNLLGVENGASFKSDFFYSTFNNDINIIKDDFSIYKNFNQKLNVNFVPEWSVTRLPLTKGEISKFIEKNSDYISKVIKLDSVPLVNFSNPIFPLVQTDDMGYFIKERLDKEFSVLNSSQYRLYGNKQGCYPVTTDVLGDFTKGNIKAENEKGITNFFINSHGQPDNIDQSIYTRRDLFSEKRISFLNSKDINQILSGNYYNLTTWTCWNAAGLGSNNILHEAMANGKCVGAMGATSVISNNGVNNRASLEDMKKNNFYYFHYVYFDSIKDGFTKSQSFSIAQKAYAYQALKNTNMLGEGNYQYSLHNLLTYHNLGLIEYWDKNTQEDEPIIKEGDITFDSQITSSDVKIDSIKYKVTASNIIFAISYDLGTARYYNFFNPPDADVIKVLDLDKGIQGKGTLEIKVPIENIKKVSGITFGLTDNSDKFDFVYFSTNQIIYN